jgi:hypothetical protein
VKKLIFTLTTIVALSSFAQYSCPAGDNDCETIDSSQGVPTSTKSSTIAIGVDCDTGTCRPFQAKTGATQSNPKGVNNTPNSQSSDSDKKDSSVRKGK